MLLLNFFETLHFHFAVVRYLSYHSVFPESLVFFRELESREMISKNFRTSERLQACVQRWLNISGLNTRMSGVFCGSPLEKSKRQCNNAQKNTDTKPLLHMI